MVAKVDIVKAALVVRHCGIFLGLLYVVTVMGDRATRFSMWFFCLVEEEVQLVKSSSKFCGWLWRMSSLWILLLTRNLRRNGEEREMGLKTRQV